MGTVSTTLPSDGQTIDAADVNTPINAILSEFNGNIDNDNIKSAAAISGSKLADSTVTSSKVDFGGSGAGIWWEEIGRTTLGSAGDTITVASFAARRFLKIIVIALPTGGTITTNYRFNGDSGTNYAINRINITNTGTVTGAGAASQTEYVPAQQTSATLHYQVTEVINIATSEKALITTEADMGAAGGSNAPFQRGSIGKWANTSDQITTVSVTNSGTGDFAIGSEVVILGHD